MADQVYLAALAGLLHDIGKFAQRAGVTIYKKDFNKEDYGDHGYHAWLGSEAIDEYVPHPFKEALSGVLFHHRVDLQDQEIRRLIIADHLAAGERRTGSEEQEDPKEAKLIPILSNVELLEVPPKGKKHRLASLSIEKESAYPTDNNEGNYAELWKQMIDELNKWKKEMGDKWNYQLIEDYFTTLLAVFHKYLWCIPSATPWQKGDTQVIYRSWPDVSLYDHNRLTSAIAACLAFDQSLPDENSNDPVALLVRGDVSGIQGFIYRLSRPEAETEHIAKRLRGRSFYLQLLTEVVAEWILKEIGLPESCAIFIGGGRFDLLIPTKSQDKLRNIKSKLSDWMLNEFHSELDILISEEEIKPRDFKDSRNLYNRLDEKIEHAKQKKWSKELSNPSFFRPNRELWHACMVCNLTPLPDSGKICDLCTLHARIGKHLPHTRYLAFCYGDISGLDQERIISFGELPFDIKFYLVREQKEINLLKKLEKVKIYSINNTDEFIVPGLASSFRFLANTAPKALKQLRVKGEPVIEQNDILHFEAIAELSKGAKRLGVLKVDVDRLGLIMSEGLNDEDESKLPAQRQRPTLSRSASISRMMDLFFSGYINRICKKVSEEWKENNPKYANDIDQLFYILYSGGDDAFIIGPWDQVLKLAINIQREFNLFSGNNPNLTLSAGYIQVKPHYPIQKFAELVNDVEKFAKNKGRNRIAAFGEAMLWRDFEWLYNEAVMWSSAIEKKDLASGFIYYLGGLYRQHLTKNGNLRPMWTPRLYYTIARRINPGMRDKYLNNVIQLFTSRKVLVPVSIVSLLIRERS